MTAIFRRELGAYFKSPLGYIYLAIFFYFGGQFFQMQVGYYQTNDMTSIFNSMFTIILFSMPILTMRLMSEDKRLKTDQALLTAPVSLGGIVWGKFLAAFGLYFVGVFSTFIYFIVLSYMSTPEWSLFFGNFLGILLLGGALISIGLFISAMTESQMVAAIGAFATMFFILMIDSIASLVPTSFALVSLLLYDLSFITRYYYFTSGIIEITNVVFFLSVMVVFNFLAMRVLEKKRWS